MQVATQVGSKQNTYLNTHSSSPVNVWIMFKQPQNYWKLRSINQMKLQSFMVVIRHDEIHQSSVVGDWGKEMAVQSTGQNRGLQELLQDVELAT